MERTSSSVMLTFLFIWSIFLCITVDGKSFNSEDKIVDENGLLADESQKIIFNDRMMNNSNFKAKTYKCDFESGICFFLSNDEKNKAKWKTGKGKLTLDDLLPSVDHTFGNVSGRYLYVNATEAKPSVSLQTLTLYENYCIRFFYYMNNALGRLDVDTEAICNQSITKYFYKPTRQGVLWKEAIFSVNMNQAMKVKGYKVNFKAGSILSSQKGEIFVALDDIEIIPGICANSRKAEELCTFDDHDCGYHAPPPISPFRFGWGNWKWNSSTHASKRDHTTNRGGYWILGTNSTSTTVEAVLRSPLYSIPQQTLNCLQFYYSIFSGEYFKIKEAYIQAHLNLGESSERKLLISKTRNVTDRSDWNYVEVKTYISNAYRFEFTAGINALHDCSIAIDDIKLLPGNCPGAEYFCKKNCGEDPNLICEGDVTKEGGSQCKCSEEYMDYIKGDEICKENVCKKKCKVIDGKSSPTVVCTGDDVYSTELQCKCTDPKREFNEATGTCEENICKNKCKVMDGKSSPDVVCVGDDVYSIELQCNCTDPKKGFNEATGICEEDFCKAVCGNAKCENRFQIKTEKDCKCNVDYTDFDAVAKECKVDFCKLVCGKAKCEDRFKVKTEKDCKCEGENTAFDAVYKDCKVDYCKSVCGNAKCEDRFEIKNEQDCKCEGDNIAFDPETKECKVDYCGSVCGKVKCEDRFERKTKKDCKCEGKNTAFDAVHKECKVDYCKAVCGNAKCEDRFEIKTEQDCKCEGDNIAFDSETKECKVDYCEYVCGMVKCEGRFGRKTEKDCKCEGENATFDAVDKECKVNYCKAVCGNAKCEDPFEKKTEQDCKCEGDNIDFDPETKECKDFCLKKCGKHSNVLCVGNVTTENGFECKCSGENTEFVSIDKTCKVNNCKEKCNIQSGTKNAFVECLGEKYGSVMCKCNDETKGFNATSKTCEDFCLKKCGNDPKVSCTGNVSIENGFQCECSGNNTEFVVKDKTCKDIFEKTDPCNTAIKTNLCGKSTDCKSSKDGTSFNCTCRKGFKSIGSYKFPGRIDSYIEICDGVCDPNPCKNDGKCILMDNNIPYCRCKPSFTGFFCDEVVEAKPIEWDLKSIVIGVIGTLLIIILPVSIMLCRKINVMSKNQV